MAEKEKGSGVSADQIREERKQRAMLGPLPQDFLRIPSKTLKHLFGIEWDRPIFQYVRFITTPLSFFLE